MEKLGSKREEYILSITGSDIDSKALQAARSMIYSKGNLEAVDKKLLTQYFDQVEGGQFKLKNILRGLVRFRQHDVIKDPPFKFCDIILCRNLFIYFNKQLQEEILLKFYDCLNPGGFLVLGMVESLIGAASNLFEHVDNKLRIYRKPERATERASNTDTILSQNDIDRIVNDMLQR